MGRLGLDFAAFFDAMPWTQRFKLQQIAVVFFFLFFEGSNLYVIHFCSLHSWRCFVIFLLIECQGGTFEPHCIFLNKKKIWIPSLGSLGSWPLLQLFTVNILNWCFAFSLLLLLSLSSAAHHQFAGLYIGIGGVGNISDPASKTC